MTELRVFVGTYTAAAPGTVHVMHLNSTTGVLTPQSHADAALEAGYLAVSPDGRNLFAVDEHKEDGRGPVGRQASVLSFAIDPDDGRVTPTARQRAYGPCPTYLSVNTAAGLLVTASHGSFDHVEHVVRTETGYRIEYLYDDSTVALYPLTEAGQVLPVADVVALEGHGADPHPVSPQAGYHPQASAHAHSAEFDPSGQFVLVCDKGTDRILTYRAEAASLRLTLASTYHAEPMSAPRHLAFHPTEDLLFVVNELTSTISSFRFDSLSGGLTLLSMLSTLAPITWAERTNEPADIVVHPNGRVLYVNNRGQDTLTCFTIDNDSGRLAYAGYAQLAASVHPGLAARSFRVDPTGTILLMADRPADVLISYGIDPQTGLLSELSRTELSQPAFVLFAPAQAPATVGD